MRTFKILWLVTLLQIVFFVKINAQVAINKTGETANSHAIFDIQSDSLGLLIPRMTTSQRIAFQNKLGNNEKGMLIFDTDKQKFCFFNGTSFTELSIGRDSFIVDEDNDTYVKIDSTDRDKIYFATKGKTYIIIDGPHYQVINSGGSVFLGDSAGIVDDLNDNRNVFVGNNAGRNNISGKSNIAIGQAALFNNSFRNNLVAIGDSALFNNKGLNGAIWEGSNNVAIGKNALFSNDNGFNNTAVGTKSMVANTMGYGNVAFGSYTLMNNQLSNFNSALGYRSLYHQKNGSYNVAIGADALFNDTTGNYNVAIGYQSLYSNKYISKLIAIGDSSLYHNIYGYYNIAVGSNALYNNISGHFNIAIGQNSLLKNTSSQFNIAIGYESLKNFTDGENNIAIGNLCLHNDTSSINNIAIGNECLRNIKRANNNLVVGNKAGFSFESGNCNTIVGSQALETIKTGNYNTVLGCSAGNTDYYLGSLSGCVYIGSFAGRNNTSDNRLFIANNSVELIYGEFDNKYLQVNGDFAVINSGNVISTIKSDDGGATLAIKAAGTSLAQIKYYDNGSFGASMGYSTSANHIFFYHGSHNVFIENGNILPDSHKRQDLGSDTKAWDDIYCDDIHNMGAAAFTDRSVTEELILYPPKPKPVGAFDEYTEKGLKELDPDCLPPDLKDGYDILTDEMTSYNYKANYEQQLEIDKLKTQLKQQQEVIDRLLKMVESLNKKNQR